MMKRIQLLRHAKSSWDEPQLADIDRPLNQRGKRACKIMAPRLAVVDCSFANVLCSPAKRARSTIKRIAKHYPGEHFSWQIDKRLYTFDSADLLTYLQALDDRICDPLVVGHNPALTELCSTLTGAGIDNIPTCAYVVLDFPAEHWQQLCAGSCRLSTFIKPNDAAGV